MWSKKETMSETTMNTPAAEATSQPVQVNTETLSAADVATLQTLSLLNPEIVSPESVNAIAEKKEGVADATEAPKVDTDNKSDDKGEVEDKEPTAEDKATEKKEPAKKSIFYADADKELKTFSNETELADFITNKYGQKIDSPEALSKFFNGTVDKWRTDSQEARESAKMVDNFNKLFEQMPEPLYNAIQAWGKAEDWTKTIVNEIPKFDYSKDFTDQNKYSIVNYYFPDKFTKDDIDNSADDPATEKAIEVAKAKYDLEKQSFENKRAEMDRDALKKIEALKDSAVSSVSKLKEAFPDMDRKSTKEVENILLSGAINDVFFNKDGTYKVDAAKKIAYVLFGDNEIVRKESKARAKAQTEALQDVISRGADRPRISKNQTVTPVPEAVEYIQKNYSKKYTY